jgi:hypothetical protein
MFCGAAMSEDNPDETTKLQRDLNEAGETIALLKQLLATMQGQDAINETDKKQAEITSPAHKTGKQKAETSSESSKLKSENEQLRHNINEQQAEIDRQKVELSKSNEKYNDLSVKYDSLREAFPIKITRIELCNYNDSGIIDNFGSVLHSAGMRYLAPKIHFTNHLKENKTFHFTINYYDSQGQLNYNAATNKRCTSKKDISTTDSSTTLSGWGNASGGYWKADTYTVEIWLEGVCLGSEKFTIN